MFLHARHHVPSGIAVGSGEASRPLIVYWALFAVPAMLALFENNRDRDRLRLVWPLFGMLLAILIGLRWETGGDWENYNGMVEDSLLAPPQFNLLADPGFDIILRLAARSPFGILLVTSISGIMMAASLSRFCSRQPRPWLAMAVAVPYLVIVMGMGYIRQGMAISCWLMGIASVEDRKVSRYIMWVLAGSAFHSTALVLLPLASLSAARNVALRLALASSVLLLLVFGLASVRAETLVTDYVGTGMASSGTAIRLAMTAIPAIIFLLYRSRFEIDPTQKGVWTLMSGGAALALFAYFLSPSSTVVDRMALYLLPVQVFVYSRLPDVIPKNEANKKLFILAILLLYVSVLFVWLNFAVNSWAWLPYRFYFLEDGICLKC